MPPNFPYDVFLSHNPQDKPRVRRLAERLRDAGLLVWFDEWAVEPGDDVTLATERGLAASQVQILCLSPAALGADWVTLERRTVPFRDPADPERRFIPLLLADCDLPDTLLRYRAIDYGEEAEAAFDELLAACRPETKAAPEPPELSFRGFQGETDYPLLLSILIESARADQIVETASLDDIRHWCAPSNRFDPSQDILFALSYSAGGEPSVIGFSRVSWYTGMKDTRIYFQTSYLLPDWRDRGFWSAMVQQNERRLREIAASHPFTSRCFFQAWATDTQEKWISVLESEGYQVVRHFNNMLHRLSDIPDRPLPAGLQVRPVQPEHKRSIWEAQKEVHQELFESVSENWMEERYEAWLADPSHTPQLWQVAWDGDLVAGMVLNRIDEAENRKRERERGYTEHIFVRRAWRRRGLASALIAQSLRILKAQGMEEVELGVDSENESGADEFYGRMGYQTFSTDFWFRKPMGMNSGSA